MTLPAGNRETVPLLLNQQTLRNFPYRELGKAFRPPGMEYVWRGEAGRLEPPNQPGHLSLLPRFPSLPLSHNAAQCCKVLSDKKMHPLFSHTHGSHSPRVLDPPTLRTCCQRLLGAGPSPSQSPKPPRTGPWQLLTL